MVAKILDTKNLSCGKSLFLRKLVLGIPTQASDKNLTQPLLPSASLSSCVRVNSTQYRKLDAGYKHYLKWLDGVSECLLFCLHLR